MRRRLLWVAATVVLLTAGTGRVAADLITIDFDTLPGGGVVPTNTVLQNQYASLGVVFSAFEDGALVGGPFASPDFISGAGARNGLFNVQTGIFPQTTFNRTDILRITFLTPAEGVSFVTQGFGDRTTFQAFSPEGILLETITNTTGELRTVTFQSSNIGRIDALQSIDDFTYRIDDLSFSPVPEPATLTLMCVGALGVLSYGWRRRRKQAE